MTGRLAGRMVIVPLMCWIQKEQTGGQRIKGPLDEYESFHRDEVSSDPRFGDRIGLASPINVQLMDVPESLASRNAEIGALDEAEIPDLEEWKQLAVSFSGDAPRHRSPVKRQAGSRRHYSCPQMRHILGSGALRMRELGHERRSSPT